MLLYTQEFKFITALKQWGSIFLLGSVDRQRSTKFKFLVCTVSVAITFCVSLFCVPVRSVCRQRSTEFESPDVQLQFAVVISIVIQISAA